MKIKSNFLRQRMLCVTAGLMIVATWSTICVGQTQPVAGMMRYPDVSKDQIVFVYADDLWVVSREGGQATPLASPQGAERNPRFSPDGKTIAFTGNYEGGTDVYTIPVGGGIPTRMTYHPARETLCDWTPDGDKLLYSSNGFAGLGRQASLFTISTSDPLPQPLPIPYGTNGSISSDGNTLAYTPHSRDTRTWKRYRGGMASDVWLFDLKKQTSKQITDFEGTDSLPMWHGDKVYYLSDAGQHHRLNIWAYHTETGEREQITKFAYFDCKWPSIGPGPKGKGEIVLQNGSDLYLVDLATKNLKVVDVTVPGDRPQLATQQIDVSSFISGGATSPSGKRVVVEARGDIWTLPVKNGLPRNLTRTDGVAERSPNWSPDGRWIAYFSDATGEYELYISQSDGRGETRQLTKNGKRYRSSPNWAPDSSMLTFVDNTGALLLYKIKEQKTVKVDVDPQGRSPQSSWSHDSGWLAYSKNHPGAGNSAIWVYKVADGSKKKLTSGFFNDDAPVFDRKGNHLFFASNRSFNSPKYEDLGSTFIYSGTQVLVALPLRKDVKHPFLAKNDEVEWKDESKSKKSEDDKSGDKKDSDSKEEASKEKEKENDEKGKEQAESKDEPAEVFTIDFDGIEARAFQLPTGQGAYSSLGVNDKNQLLFGTRAPRGSAGESSIKLIDLSSDEPKPVTVVDGTSGFYVSADGKKLMVRRGSSIYVVATAAGQKLSKAVSTSGMMASIRPRSEWKQMFVDAWRIEREFFYDPTMHGVDWEKVRQHYEPMVDDCVSRRDLGFVIGEMIAELNVGHAYYRSGSVEDGPSANTGLLGCTFASEKGAYKIDKIFRGAAWDIDARNPLDDAGIQSGEFLLAVNDLPLTTKTNPYKAFQNLGGSTVILTISKDAELDDDDRRVVIKTLTSDSNLRFRSWIESNRARVSKATKGKVGYIYVVNTGVPGQNDLVRQLYGQLEKEALIIDDRWNGGGQIPTRFIELLNRPVTNYWARRHGTDWTWPRDSHQGPKCMLTNGMAGSGGDMFPALFKQNKLGKLIGMRTWGGLVGITGGPRLLDGASVTAPSFAYYDNDGTWGIEGHGVDPDIEVIDDPAKMKNGRDPQLEVAIRQMLKEIKTNGFKRPRRPAYPDRSKFGIKPEDK